MKLKKLLGEIWRYGQVRLIATGIGVAWTTIFVDIFHWSGLATGLLYLPVVGTITFIIHKYKGAKF